MAPALAESKDVKLVADVGAWLLNAATSVGLIMINKQLMSIYGFAFATTLTGLHFSITAMSLFLAYWVGLLKESHLPRRDLITFAIASNFSIVGMNVSLMWNSVGFYQISKLAIIPCTCFLETFLDNVRFSRSVKLSILLVLLGVGLCTVSEVHVNIRGFAAALVAATSCALQNYYTHSLQKQHSLGSLDLLGHLAPVQGVSLLLLGPVVDYYLTGMRINRYDYSVPSVTFIMVSCLFAVGTNASQFIIIGRFTAVGYQVLGHMKTVLVLLLGFYLFGVDHYNLQHFFGMVVAVIGMVWYGTSSSSSSAKATLPAAPSKPPPTALQDKTEYELVMTAEDGLAENSQR